jgi:hypothetical protein
MNYELETDRRFTIETYIRLAREHGFKEEANKVAKQYLASLDPKLWKPDYLLEL